VPVLLEGSVVTSAWSAEMPCSTISDCIAAKGTLPCTTTRVRSMLLMYSPQGMSKQQFDKVKEEFYGLFFVAMS
jgi:hypothetical protein